MTTQPAQTRDRSLDGLRGLAALGVALGHALLISNYFGPSIAGAHAPTGSLRWWLADTPVHTLLGAQSVLTFFVLSGFVLVLPFLRVSTTARWVAYYPRRLVRLYLPVWGSLVLALALYAAVSHTPSTGTTGWLNFHAGADNLRGIARSAFLLVGVNGLNDPLWSLQWEMLFSLLLPAYVLFARHMPKLVVPKALVLLACTAVGAYTAHTWLVYMPVFALGSLMAVHRDDLRRLAGTAFSTAARRAAAAVIVVAVLNANTLVYAAGTPTPATTSVGTALTIAGCCGVVWLAMALNGMRRLCETPVVQWLGTRSFSLYLVHSPLLVAWAFGLGGTPHLGLLYTAYLPTALIVAELFYRFVERPSHRISQRVGAAVLARTSEPASVARPRPMPTPRERV